MVADPFMLLVVIFGGILIAELVRSVGRLLLQLVTDQVIMVIVPLVIRLSLAVLIGFRLTPSLRYVHQIFDLSSNLTRLQEFMVN